MLKGLTKILKIGMGKGADGVVNVELLQTVKDDAQKHDIVQDSETDCKSMAAEKMEQSPSAKLD